MINRYVVRLFGTGSYAAESPTAPGDRAWVSEQKKARKFSYREEAAGWIQERHDAKILKHLNFSILRLKPKTPAGGFIIQAEDDPKSWYIVDAGPNELECSSEGKPHVFPTKEAAEKHIQFRVKQGWADDGFWTVAPAPEAG